MEKPKQTTKRFSIHTNIDKTFYVFDNKQQDVLSSGFKTREDAVRYLSRYGGVDEEL